MPRLVMITTPELAPGFALAGTEVSVATNLEDAAAALERLMDDPEVGVIGVGLIHEPLPLLTGDGRQRSFLYSLCPLLVAPEHGIHIELSHDHNANALAAYCYLLRIAS